MTLMTSSTSERSPFAVGLIRFASRVALCPFFNIQIAGLQNIPGKGSFILLPKHQRWEDTPILAITIKRPLYYIAKIELFNNPISGWFISSIGGIPLNRRRPTRSRHSFGAMLRLLEKGEGIVIFPEGTYFKERMGPGHSGLIRMIFSHLDTNFLPVGIRYIKGRGRILVKLSIGKSVRNESYGDAQEITDYIMKEIARLSGLD